MMRYCHQTITLGKMKALNSKPHSNISRRIQPQEDDFSHIYHESSLGYHGMAKKQVKKLHVRPQWLVPQDTRKGQGYDSACWQLNLTKPQKNKCQNVCMEKHGINKEVPSSWELNSLNHVMLYSSWRRAMHPNGG